MSHTKKYNDTWKGVRSMLRYNFSGKFKKLQYERDPWVSGVWKVTNREGAVCIAYLSGYPDPWGRVREFNDAEFSDDWLF